MSAIGRSHRIRIISAHADHNRSDFVFRRCQSPALRDAPWEHRLKPMRTWSEIGSYAVAGLACVVAMTSFI